jgi:hypothetical protein
MFDRHEVEHVAITMADGSIAVMQFITRAWKSRLGRKDDEAFAREATDEAIQAEIDKTAFSQPVVSWRRISPADLPKSRDNRDAWRDDGTKIVVDRARIGPQASPDPIRAELDALKQRIADLEALRPQTRK